jgi:phage terminase large subunit
VLQATVCDRAHEWYARHKADAIYVDPSAAGLIGAMRAMRMNVAEADNAVNDGIQQVKQHLAMQGDGRPRLTIDPACTNTINEFTAYVWQRRDGVSLDKPIKENDHAMDALRYALMGINTRTYDKPGAARYA